MRIDITDYGAIGDGRTLCTRSIQRALDACAQAGGGEVLVPAGVYVTGTLHLRSLCTLRLESGAELRGSPSMADYERAERPAHWLTFFPYGLYALLLAEGVEHCGIVGEGTINGDALAHFPNPEDPEGRRPFLVIYCRSRDVYLRDVRLLDPGAFAFYGIECECVRIDGVQVRSWGGLNGDGLDFDGSRDCVISNCILETGDDSISLKTLAAGKPCENFVITNCLFRSMWAGIRLGVESTSDMRNICVSNCAFENCNDGLKIQANSGGVYEDLRFSNLTMRNVRRPILITQNCFRMSDEDASIRPEGSQIRRVTIEGVTAVLGDNDERGEGLYRPCVVIGGLPSRPVQDIVLRDLVFEFPGGETGAPRLSIPEFLDYTEYYIEAPHFGGRLPAAGLYLRHVEGVTLSGLTLRVREADTRPLLFFDHVRRARLTDVCAEGATLLRAGCCAGLRLRDCSEDGRDVALGTDASCGLDTELEDFLGARYREALEIECEMARQARVVDAARAGACARVIRAEEWVSEAVQAVVPEAGTAMAAGSAVGCARQSVALCLPVLPDAGRCFVYLPSLCGNVRALWNGAVVDAVSLPKEYRFRSVWAVDMSAFAGETGTLCLEWETPGARDGVYDRAFGRDPLGTANGLLAEAEVRVLV